MTENLLVYVGQDVGTSTILFVTTDNELGRKAWVKLKKEKDFRYPEIHKFKCDNWKIFPTVTL